MKAKRKIALLAFVLLLSLVFNGNDITVSAFGGDEDRQQTATEHRQDADSNQTMEEEKTGQHGQREELQNTAKQPKKGEENVQGEKDEKQLNEAEPEQKKTEEDKSEEKARDPEKPQKPEINLLGNAKIMRAPLEKTKIKITEFSIKKDDYSNGNTYWVSERFKIKVAWDASDYGNTLHKGDYFIVNMSDKFLFPGGTSSSDFDVLSPDNKVVAKAKVNPDTINGGGTVKVTFTDYVEDRYHIRGTLWLASRFNRAKVTTGSSNKFVITVGGKIIETDVHVGPLPEITDEIIGKWGERVKDPNNVTVENEVYWIVRINYNKRDFHNVVVEDELSVESGESMDGLRYLENSFLLREVEFNNKGETVKVHKTFSNEEMKQKVQFLNPQKTKFKIELGNIGNKQYLLTYKSTYRPGLKIKNRFHFKADEDDKTTESAYVSAASGGNGQGDLLGKLKIIKLDDRGDVIKLAGTKFKITNKNDNTTFELVTDANGEVTSGRLIPGEYIIEEITPPPGYLKDPNKYTVTVKKGEITVQSITNKKEKISIPVIKKWQGYKELSVTVKLFADGVDTGQKLVLNESGNWKGKFENLDKYKETKEIKYTVKEEGEKAGKITFNGREYVVTVKGDQKTGYTIENKRAPWIPPPPPTPGTDYIDLKVKKDWEDSSGKKADAPVKSIKVRLYRNGTATDRMLELNESNKWEGTFQRLEKYVAGTSTPYEYTVQEEGAVNGKIVFDGKEFKVQVEGTMKDGYRIINKKDNPPPDVPKDEKISISVIKKWIGEEKDSITIHLLLNGKEIRSKVITKQDGWKYTFENLDKYVDGKLAEYIVKEDKVDGYVTTVTGKSEEGFVITNRKNTTPPPPSTPPTPKVPELKRFLPKTGDGLNPMEKVVALMLIGIMLTAFGFRKKIIKGKK